MSEFDAIGGGALREPPCTRSLSPLTGPGPRADDPVRSISRLPRRAPSYSQATPTDVIRSAAQMVKDNRADLLPNLLYAENDEGIRHCTSARS